MNGCETLEEEHRLSVFENRLLGRLFGTKREEVTGGWVKLHNDKIHNLYSLPNINIVIKSRIMKWEGHVTEEKWIPKFSWRT